LQETAIQHDIGEKSKLEGGATKFTFESRCREGSFAPGDLHQIRGAPFELVGHGVEKLRTPGQWTIGVLARDEGGLLTQSEDFGRRRFDDV
jgi:hypothetical protein